MPGPDHQASLEPDELRLMVKYIRQVEAALGSSRKIPGPSEINNQKAVRKSIVASSNICQGDLFTTENLTVKRPGDGISPMYLWKLLGKRANRNYQQDEQVGE